MAEKKIVKKKKFRINKRGRIALTVTAVAASLAILATVGITAHSIKVEQEQHALVLARAEELKAQEQRLKDQEKAERIAALCKKINEEAEVERIRAEREAALAASTVVANAVDTAVSAAGNPGTENAAAATAPSRGASTIAAGSNGAAAATTPSVSSTSSSVIGYIAIPDTPLNNAIFMHSTDDFYLTHDESGSYEPYPGEIYANKCNSKDFSDYITVLYGHNMKNGSFFGCLHYFEKSDFFSEHPNFDVRVGDKTYHYTVYASVQYGPYYIPSMYDVKSSASRDAFIAELSKWNSSITHFNSNVTIGGNDKVLVCSTCAKNDPNHNNRYILVSKLMSID